MAISVRNFLYQISFLKSNSFSIPIIGVGNLSMGGTGKTPHIEYLLSLLREYLKIATLSRGYNRKTRGFKMVGLADTAESVGDEPLQFKLKYQDVHVAVAESRSIGIPKLLIHDPNIQLVLLDDSFQHLSVKPGLNILLTDYGRLFTKDYLLPSGNLREWRSAYKRADMIIVSKCPDDMNGEDRERITQEINPLPHQRLYFSKYEYGTPYYIFNPNSRLRLSDEIDIILVSAIANTDYLNSYIEPRVKSLRNVEFEDHHMFSNHDVSRIKLIFEHLNSDKKAILTTEKDATRLLRHRKYLIENRIPVFILPVRVSFLDEDREKFNTSIKDFLLNFKV